MNYAQKLEQLRQEMYTAGVDGYLVPRTDEYQGEYVAAYVERLKWLTGFSGSAGMTVVLDDRAVVMSDGRYTIQLAQEVDQNLYSLENSQEVVLADWLKENAKNKIIGFDPKLFTPAQIEKLEKEGLKIQAIDENLIDKVWEDQPEPPKGQVSLFPEKYAGASAQDKIKTIQTQVKEVGVSAVVLTLSDSIAWLLNIRGSDIPYIPVALSYAIVPREGKVQWFIDQDKIGNEVPSALKELVELRGESEIEGYLKNLSGKVWLDTKRSSLYFKNLLSDVLEKDDPCIVLRAEKNEAEQKAMRDAHIRDGVAMTKFLQWLDTTNDYGDEITIEKKLEEFRAQAPEFKEPSFSTIAGFGANGAIVHYRANDRTTKTIEQGNLLLLDSGAQYEDGTTDITRTVAIGKPSAEMIKNNTLVLKGHIALANAVFKKGTLGKELDALARAPLQAEELDYSHGTGHGVGCYLSVHEEAANLSPRGESPVLEGMILSNEPGYYKEGEYGIRIENLILAKEKDEKHLYFETITFAPIDKNLIDASLLTREEKDWLNRYHKKVFETLSPLVEEPVLSWLEDKTSPI